jgi:FkbM family methyltransferase
MKINIRSSFGYLAFNAITLGLRLPDSKAVANYRQWSHLADLIKQLRINVFLDVGANRGFFSKHLRMSGYRGHIFSFEPIQEECERIRTLSAKDPKWIACEYALGSESGTKDFHVYATEGETVFSSFLPFVDGRNAGKTKSVEIRALDDVLFDLLRGLDAPRIFLKMDTQGFDRQVMEGAVACMPLVRGIQSEISVVPLYEGMTHYTDSLANYEALGFSLMDMFVVNRMPDGRVLEYDCVMARLD